MLVTCLSTGFTQLDMKICVSNMAAEKILEWKLLPRFMMLIMTLMSWRVVEWFMSLPEPSAAQAGLVSVVTGAMTGAFAVWMNHEGKHPNQSTQRTSESRK
jgi:hypothetical protein